MTAFDVITSALKLVAVLADGEQPTDDTANQGLAVFNDMVDSWSTERLAIFTTKSEDFPFVQGQQDYTMGPTGNFNTARPVRIDSISAILLNDPSNPVEVPIPEYTVEDWQNIPVKNVQGSFPTLFYNTGDYPLLTLKFWPIPSAGNSVRIYSWQALSQATGLTSLIAFPPGYAMAFRYNLAVLLAAEFGVSPDKYAAATVQDQAVKSLARLKTINAPDLQLRSDLSSSPKGYSYAADMFGLPYGGPIQ